MPLWDVKYPNEYVGVVTAKFVDGKFVKCVKNGRTGDYDWAQFISDIVLEMSRLRGDSCSGLIQIMDVYFHESGKPYFKRALKKAGIKYDRDAGAKCKEYLTVVSLIGMLDDLVLIEYIPSKSRKEN